MGPTPQTERRRLQRIPLQGRVTGHYTNGDTYEITGVSKDVSAEGMFIFLRTDVALHARVELILELPSHDVFKNRIMLHCVGRVVRVEGAVAEGTFGIAVVFEDIEISSS